MRKPKDWGQPCPNPDCTHYRLMHRGNISAIATYTYCISSHNSASVLSYQ